MLLRAKLFRMWKESEKSRRRETDEPDKYFKNFETIHKGKRIIDKKTDHKRSVQAYIDYIVEKNEISQPVEGARSRFMI